MIGQVLPFQQYTMKDGLVSNGVSALLQDSRGFMWIGTADGVSVFDGYEFTNYSEAGGRSIGLVTALAESKISPGTVWIASLGTGINRFTKGEVAIAEDPPFRNGATFSMVEDQNGRLWYGTDLGLYIIDTVAGSPPIRLLEGSTSDVVESTGGWMWTINGGTIIIFSQRREEIARIESERFHAGAPERLLASMDGSVWVATDAGTLLQFRDTLLIQSRSLQREGTRTMCEDSQGYLWICTGKGNIIKIPKSESRKTPELLTRENGVAGEVLTVVADKEDNLWIGLVGHGLQKLAYRNVLIFPTEPLPLGFAYQPPLCSDSTGRFWAIALDGLLEVLRNDAGQWTLVSHSLSELGLNARPLSVQLGSNGALWVGTLDEQIHVFAVERPEFKRSRLRRTRVFHPTLPSGKGSLKIFAIDGQGNIWCNFINVAVVIFDRTLTPQRTLTEADGLPSGNIAVMFADRNNVMWLGGVGKGVASLPVPEIRTGKLQKLGRAEGLPDDQIRAISQDQRGRMMFGTRFGGLAILENGAFSILNTSAGLSNNCVWSMSGDGPHHLWVCTQVGLQRVDLTTLKPEFPLDALSADRTICCTVNRGTVVAWQYGSLVVFEGSNQEINNVPPPIYVTRLEVNAHPVTPGDRLTFPYDRNTITLGFVGISFREERGLRYQYRLLGLNEEWSLPGTERTVTLTELPPDLYRFEIRAINSQGIQSMEPASLVFTILPPFWKTSWAYLAYFLVLGTATILWRRHEIRTVQQKEREEARLNEARLRAEMAEVRIRAAETEKELEKQQTRMQIARDLHDDVGSTLSSITLFVQALTRGMEQGGKEIPDKLLSLISESSSHAKEAISDIIWSIDPGNDSWENVTAKLSRYAADLFESRGIDYTIAMDLPTSVAMAEPQRRRHFWLLFKEIITNILKHSQCTKTGIRLEKLDGFIRLTVDDNGIGFDVDATREGNGLKNIRSRAKDLGATVQLSSAPGSGTQWVMDFPA